jgi:predicted nucleic acid-binding protein
MVTSEAVLDELREGGAYHKEAALNMALTLPLLPVENEIVAIVQAYVKHKVMPQDPAGDALHLALASFHACDYLVTWNCRHLANANKFGHIRIINQMLGLRSPDLVTPQELLGETE